MTKLCTELVYSTPVRQCTHPAKYVYATVRGRIDFLCGVHARRFQGIPNLKPIVENKNHDQPNRGAK